MYDELVNVSVQASFGVWRDNEVGDGVVLPRGEERLWWEVWEVPDFEVG
jgi:hypothetical protein